MLSDKEKEQYSRHILLDKVGLKGQQKLKDAKVLVIGAGGLGCPVLQYLAAAGIGNIGIVDFDEITISNLQRQVLFNIEDVGRNKAIVATEKLEKLNPYINIRPFTRKLIPENAFEVIADYDIVVDGTDNFSTRYMINDVCVILNKPLVYGAIFKFEGQVSVFNYNHGPSYRCLFPEPPESGSVPNCSQIGVMGVLPGIIGCMQANEVLKLVIGIGTPLTGRLLMYNTLLNDVAVINIVRNQTVIDAVKNNAGRFKEMNYDEICGIKTENDMNNNFSEISATELRQLLKIENITIVDVREPWEEPKFREAEVIEAPLGELNNYVTQIPKTGKVVMICRSGARSSVAIEQLQKEHNYNNLINLKGGMLGW